MPHWKKALLKPILASNTVYQGPFFGENARSLESEFNPKGLICSKYDKNC